MKPARIYIEGAVLGAILGIAVWAYTFRVSETIRYLDGRGRPFHPPDHVHAQPWWSAPVTVVLVVAAIGAALWFAPKSRRMILAAFVNPPRRSVNNH